MFRSDNKLYIIFTKLKQLHYILDINSLYTFLHQRISCMYQNETITMKYHIY